MKAERQTLWVEEMCRLLAPIERQTLEKLGEEKGGFFTRVVDDWTKINSAVIGGYPGEQGYNLGASTRSWASSRKSIGSNSSSFRGTIRYS